MRTTGTWYWNVEYGVTSRAGTVKCKIVNANANARASVERECSGVERKCAGVERDRTSDRVGQ